MINIYTRQLAEEQQYSGTEPFDVIDPKNIGEAIQTLKKHRQQTDEIAIYDISPRLNHNRILLPVNDHINRTGNNPLIGRQHELNVEFIDISDIYEQKINGVVTVCCGDSEAPEEFQYPSMFLSHLSILARVLNYKKIHAYVVV